jgi:uncharacterized membrane protein YcaP (DUF421 family)
LDVVIRAAIAFLFIFLITRVVGRRELSTLEPFDLILLVVLGDMVQQGVTQNDTSVTGLLLVVSTLALMTVATSYLSFKVPRLRPVLDGSPIVIVQDGQLLEGNLRHERLTLEDVMVEARGQQVAELADIRWAVLEANGSISVIPKEQS